MMRLIALTLSILLVRLPLAQYVVTVPATPTSAGGTAITLVQSNIGQTVSGSTITATYTNNTAGDISVAGVVWCSATGNAATVSSGTDTAGNTYTVDTARANYHSNAIWPIVMSSSFIAPRFLPIQGRTLSVNIPPRREQVPPWRSSFGVDLPVQLPGSAWYWGDSRDTITGHLDDHTNGSYAIPAGVIDDGSALALDGSMPVSPFTRNRRPVDLSSECSRADRSRRRLSRVTTRGPTVGEHNFLPSMRKLSIRDDSSDGNGAHMQPPIT